MIPAVKTPSLLQTIELIADPVKFLDRCSDRYGDTFSTRVLGLNSPPVVFFGSPEALQDIFTAPTSKFDFSRATHVFKPLMGEQSIVLQQERSHQRTRQLLLPPFHGERMRHYGELICEITTEATQHLNPGTSFLISEIIPDITLQIILQVVFGINPGSRYQQLKKLLSSLLEDVTSPLYSSLFFFPPLQWDLGARSPWGSFLRRQQEIDELIYSEIEERRTQNNTSLTDILSLLLSARDEAGEPMTDVELRDQLVSLLLLGYETTAASLAWAFYWIHSLPSVKEKLEAELNQQELNPEQITKLPYLTALCQETLRTYPIALISMPRMAKEGMEIGGYQIEAKTVIIPCIYLAHQRPSIYPNPREFQPERFLGKKFTPYEFLPFGGGSRGCIGAAFSLYEMKLIIATILSQFQLELADKKPIKPVRRGITIVPSRGVKIVVTHQRQLQKVGSR